MDQSEIQTFRERYFLDLISRLVLKTALEEPVINGHLSIEESQALLKGWLDKNSDIADSAYGEHFQNDPAQAALYADEVKDMIEELKAKVDKIADEGKKLIQALRRT